MTYSFRNRILLSITFAAAPGVNEVVLSDEGPDGVVELCGPAPGEPIHDALELRLRGRNFPTFDAAGEAGRLWRNHLTIACAHSLSGIKIGSDEDVATPKFDYGLPYYQDPESRLRDAPGLLVFKADSEPGPSGLFASARVLRGLQPLHDYVLPWITQREYGLTPQQSLAYTLTHASFFEDNPETAFILLLTAVEALLPPREDNPKDIAEVIEVLQATLAEMPGIDEDLRKSVDDVLEVDKYDTIIRRGKQLVNCLGTERFGGVCYPARPRGS